MAITSKWLALNPYAETDALVCHDVRHMMYPAARPAQRLTELHHCVTPLV